MNTTIGIDIGGTRIKMGLLRGVELLATEILDVNHSESLQKELPFLEKHINSLLEKNNVNNSFHGLGISLPCLVDSVNNKILSRYVKYTDAGDLDLNQWAKKNWGVHLKIENDAKSALTGEWQFGVAKGCKNVVLLTLGTGIGSAVLLDGKLISGNNYRAGNLGGHMTIDYQGLPCNCGDIGCAEAMGSSWALPNLAQKYHHELSDNEYTTFEPNYKWVFRAASEGNKLATHLKIQSLKVWSAVAKNLIYSFDPELVILSGGILGSRHEIIPTIQNYVDKLPWLNGQKIEIKAANHPDWAGVMGAAYLAQL